MALAQFTICDADPANADSVPLWPYEEALMRNRRLITDKKQQRLRNSRLTFAGTESAWGVHLIMPAQLGIAKFTIADPGMFDVLNVKHQRCASFTNFGGNKAEVMAGTTA
jgi:tRNA A37 threonylcarbamoyladenosine dehydratase